MADWNGAFGIFLSFRLTPLQRVCSILLRLNDPIILQYSIPEPVTAGSLRASLKELGVTCWGTVLSTVGTRNKRCVRFYTYMAT